MPIELVPADPPPLPPDPPSSPLWDVVDAIVDLWTNGTLGAIMPAPYPDVGPAPPPYPFAVLTLAGERVSSDTGLVYLEDKLFNLSVFHTRDDELRQYRDTIQGVLDPLNRTKALTFENGTLKGFRRTGGMFRDTEDRTPDGRPIYQQTIFYMVTVQRVRP